MYILTQTTYICYYIYTRKGEVSLSMLKAYKYRLYPNREQQGLINKTFGCVRFVYNYYLAKKIELYKSEQKSLTYNQCSKDLTAVKKELEWLKEIDKFALQNSLKNLDTAYQNFFREIKKGNKNQGFPKFKSKKTNRLSYTTNFTNNNIEVDFENNKIKSPKLKWVDCIAHREFDGLIKSCTISKTPSGKYFASVLVETKHSQLPQNSNAIGMDLGVSDLLITSDGEVIDNQRITYQYEQKLAKLQRQLAKKKKDSNNFHKQRIKVARLHEKIANKRKDNHHKISSRIVKENQFIFSENLNVSGMVRNHNLAKAIHDVSWYELTRQLEYKSNWNGRVYHKVDRYFPSSQLCSVCGYKNTGTKDLSVREWICPECGSNHDRDINASINILNQGMKEIV